MEQSRSDMPAYDPEAPFPFDCSVCLESKTNIGYGPRLIEDSPICTECVVDGIDPLFEKAINHEHEYPPKWGGTKLEAKDFTGALSGLGEDFLERYQRIEEEYQTTGHRIYCKHIIRAARKRPRGAKRSITSTFYSHPIEIDWMKRDGEALQECGHMLTAWSPSNSGTMICYHCGGKTCVRCEKYFTFYDEHTCILIDPSSREYIFKDQVRGKHYQVCPGQNCSNIVALADGCNEIVCNICETHFCFICGGKAEDGSGHWAEGNPCPRWNQPGKRNAHYDPPEEEDECEDEEAEAEAEKIFMELAIERGETRLQANNGPIEIDAQMFIDIFQDLEARGIVWHGLASTSQQTRSRGPLAPRPRMARAPPGPRVA